MILVWKSVRILLAMSFMFNITGSFYQKCATRYFRRHYSVMSQSFSHYQEHFPNVTPMQWKQLNLLSEYISEWNQKVNVVSRKDIDELIPNHIVPAMSISLCRKFIPGEHIIDVGTGGGLPGLPLAIMHSDVMFTLLDSSSKKMMVVEDIVERLNLKNVYVVTSRAEEFHGKFDVLVGRSVSAMPNFLSWSSHLLRKDATKENGLYYIKGGDLEDELKFARITQHSIHPIKELVKSLPESDKFILHIPTDQIISFDKNRKR